jgi:P27 family predicted phage terminase small subunit
MPRGGDHSSKPAILKKLEGDRSKVGRTKLEARIEREPRGRGRPKLPAHLSPAELVEFRHVIETAPQAILTGADQRLIECYCVAIAAAMDAREKLEKTGKLIAGANGPVLNPFWKIWREAANDARMMGGELGLSPASRARLSVEPEQSDDPLALLLGDDADLDGTWSTIPKAKQ